MSAASNQRGCRWEAQFRFPEGQSHVCQVMYVCMYQRNCTTTLK